MESYLRTLRRLLNEIAQAKGEPNEDRLIHAENTIRNQVTLALNGLHCLDMHEGIATPADIDQAKGANHVG